MALWGMKKVMGIGAQLNATELNLRNLGGAFFAGLRGVATGSFRPSREWAAGALRRGRQYTPGRYRVSTTLGGTEFTGMYGAGELRRMGVGLITPGMRAGGIPGVRTGVSRTGVNIAGYAGFAGAAYGGYRMFGAEDFMTNVGAVGGYAYATRLGARPGFGRAAGGAVIGSMIGRMF